MKSDDTEFTESKRIDREAADWVAKKIGGLSPQEQDAFFDWLAADPRHGEWYAKHARFWKKLDLLAQWMPEHGDRPNLDLLRGKVRARRFGWAMGMAAALALVFLAFFAVDEPDAASPDLQNLVASGYERHELPDGSVVELNVGTALKVNYTEAIRRIDLVSKEAHFEVARDPDRPFVVSVRGIEVRAVGTAFNVKVSDDAVQVIVTEGRVRLGKAPTAPTPGPAKEGGSLASAYTRELVVGQMTQVSLLPSEEPMEVKEVSLREMEELLAWKPQLFEFNATPLSEVVRQFNDRNQTHLVLGEAALGQVPIVASFRSANVEHFVELLKLSMELRVERSEEGHIVLYSDD